MAPGSVPRRSTWGIWIRWSINARPSKPISSAVGARSRSQPAGSLSPQGNRETWSTTPGLVPRSMIMIGSRLVDRDAGGAVLIND